MCIVKYQIKKKKRISFDEKWLPGISYILKLLFQGIGNIIYTQLIVEDIQRHSLWHLLLSDCIRDFMPPSICFPLPGVLFSNFILLNITLSLIGNTHVSRISSHIPSLLLSLNLSWQIFYLWFISCCSPPLCVFLPVKWSVSKWMAHFRYPKILWIIPL